MFVGDEESRAEKFGQPTAIAAVVDALEGASVARALRDTHERFEGSGYVCLNHRERGAPLSTAAPLLA